MFTKNFGVPHYFLEKFFTNVIFLFIHKITNKQKTFIYEYIKNGQNAVQAALFAYDTENYKTASKIADSNLKSPCIAKAIDKVLTEQEITLDRIAGIISEGLNAKARIYNKKLNDYEESNFSDHNTRIKFLDLYTKLLGLNAGPGGKKQVPMFTGVLSTEQISNIRERTSASG